MEQGGVVAEIRQRQRQKRGVTSIYREAPTLYGAAYRYFDSWHAALKAAGVKPDQRKWTKQGVIDAILLRRQVGLPIRGVNREDSALYAVSIRHFGGWSKALLAAGLPTKPKQYLSREAARSARIAASHVRPRGASRQTYGITRSQPSDREKNRLPRRIQTCRNAGVGPG